MEDDALSMVRGRKIGFVFQAFNLISELTIVENVAVPLFYQRVNRAERTQRAIEKLERVGLGDRLTHRPKELSGGQQQRVAVARALVTEPAIIMADEPTGNLDSATGIAILDLITELHESGMTIIMVTHDDKVADRCERIVRLRDGAHRIRHPACSHSIGARLSRGREHLETGTACEGSSASTPDCTSRAMRAWSGQEGMGRDRNSRDPRWLMRASFD